MKQILVLALLLLVACSTAETQQVETQEIMVESPEPQQTDESGEKLAAVQAELEQVKQKLSELESKPEPQVIVEPPAPVEVLPAPAPVKKIAPETSPDVQTLLSLADSKIKSYSFAYAPPPDTLARDIWYIRGNKIKVTLFEDNYVTPEEYYDTIYLDTEQRTAVAYCEDQSVKRCPNQTRVYTLDFEKTAIKTPYQWVKEVSGAERISSEVLYDRSMTVVRYVKEGVEFYQWIDDFSGLPVRVAEGPPPHKSLWEFRYLTINNVAESMVIKS